jgi:ankyrin repeat protein
MKRAAFALLLTSFVACDPGRPENTPLSREDRSDWFASASLDVLPLDLAIRRDDLAEVRRLLESGTNPNLRWSQTGDRFPLREAIDTEGRLAINRREIIRLLLTHGADPSARWCPFDSRGHWSAWGGNVSCRSATGITALIYASFRGQREIVAMLLEAGAVPEAEDFTLRSALDYTKDDVIFELISRAMFPDLETRDQKALAWLDRHFKEPFIPAARETPLTRALSSWRWDNRTGRGVNRVRIVLSLGADPNERTGDGQTPLAMALGSLSSVRMLLEHGADPNQRWCELDQPGDKADPVCTIEKGITPLMWAARSGEAELVTLLLEHKADRSLTDWAGRRAVHYAATRETWELTLCDRSKIPPRALPSP